MRNYYKWVLLIAVSIGLFTAIVLVSREQKESENNLKNQMQLLQQQTKEQHNKEVENLKKQIQEQDSKYKQLEQSKAAEKARMAAETAAGAARASITQRVVNTAVPTAQASQVPQNAPGDVQSIIVKWANHYGVNAQHMLNIARCESTFNPNARNPSYSAGAAGNPVGLFQHVEGYWPARAAKYGVPGASIYDADAQARVTAAMFADGQAHLWECR